jgi:predicted amidophosphoribosyltransferase
VRLAGLVRVQPWAQRDKSHWYRIQAKCVDFVVCDERTFAPRLVVELDDASHDREDRQARDAFVDEVLAGVGLPILHVRWQRQYSQAALAGQVLTALGGRAGEATSPEQSWQPIPAAPAAIPAPAPVAASQPAQATIVEQRRLCGQCEAELRVGARFCAQCGATFSRAG